MLIFDMMNIIKKILLLMYYSIYKAYCKVFRLNPVIYTYKLPFAKRYFAKRGYDPTTAYMDNMNNFTAPIFTGGLVAGSLSLFLTGFLSFFCGISKINIDFEYQIFVSFLFSFLFFYFFVLRNDKEVKKEFKQFDKMLKWKKYLWLLITLSFFVISIIIWWKGMFFFGKSIKNFY
jgi:hypothetical protein